MHTNVSAGHALHERALVVLAHDHMVRAEDLRRDIAGGVTAKVVQATVSGRAFSDSRAEFERSLYSTEGFMRDAMEAYDEIFATIETMPDEVFVVHQASDIGEAKRTGRLGLILGAEGAKLLEGSLAALRIFHRLGMRHLQLHWATRNQVGTAQSDTDEPGLTEFGREVVAEVNALGMLLDVSHSSPATIADVLAITDRPVINSHTGARELNPRSTQLLWDDQIKDLADNGGVAAIHFCTQVLLSEGRQATIDDVLTHIDYLVDAGGIDSVGLGPDYLLDGTQRTRNVSFNQRIAEDDFTWTKDFEDTSTLPNVTVALLERGYTEDETLKILGGNMLRVIEASLP